MGLADKRSSEAGLPPAQGAKIRGPTSLHTPSIQGIRFEPTDAEIRRKTGSIVRRIQAAQAL